MNSPTNTDNPYVANEKNKPNDIYTSSIPEISRTHPHPTNTGYGTETQVFTALEARVQHSSVHVTSHNFHELTNSPANSPTNTGHGAGTQVFTALEAKEKSKVLGRHLHLITP